MRYQIHWCRPILPNGETRIEEAERFNADVPDEPELSYDVQHVIEWFWRLNRRRQQGWNGPLPISYREIRAWIDCTAQRVAVEEIEWLMAMDDAFLDQLAIERSLEEKRKEERKKLEELKRQASGR